MSKGACEVGDPFTQLSTCCLPAGALSDEGGRRRGRQPQPTSATALPTFRRSPFSFFKQCIAASIAYDGPDPDVYMNWLRR